MIRTSFRTRSVIFAYLIGPPRILTREQGNQVWDRVCGALGVDDLTFKYTPVPGGTDPSSEAQHGTARGFALQMQRQLGRGGFKVGIDAQNIDAPVRFRMEYTWPPSSKHVAEDFDVTSKAAFEALGDGWQRVLAETRIRGQVEAVNTSSVEYLVDRVLRLEEGPFENLEARPDFASISLHTPAGDPSEDDSLGRPKRECKIEVLKEDARSLYVELMSQWPQLAIESSGMVKIDARRIRQFTENPSEYVQNGLTYIEEIMLPLFASGAESAQS